VSDPQPPLEASPDSTSNHKPLLSTPKSHWLTELFVGPEGLRPGWGLTLYLVLAYELWVALSLLLTPAMHRLSGTLWMDLAAYVEITTCVVLPAVAMSRIENRPFGLYGLPAKGAFGRGFAWGMLWGFAALSLLLVILHGFHAFNFGTAGLHGIRALKFALFWGVYFLLVGFFEEFVVRGYTLFTLSRGITFWPAALVLSAYFGYRHLQNPGESWVGALSAGLIGLFFCFTVRRTGDLWFAVGLHASWDWAQSYLYGVPDSGTMIQGHYLTPSSQGPVWLTGGSVGPEGSVLVFVVIAILFAAFHATHPAKPSIAAT